jgi:tetratricopeptide (TPR) repeat protein
LHHGRTMTRLPKQWVATLALAAGSLVIGGCGDWRSAPLPSGRSVAARSGPANAEPRTPQAFVAPERLVPIPAPALESLQPVAAKQPPAPIQAQYAQPAASLPDLPPMHDVAKPTTTAGAPVATSIYGPELAPATTSLHQIAPVAAPPRPAAMQPVSEQAAAMSRRAYGMAQKGMLFSAKQELVQALQLVAQARDVQAGATIHSQALATGLTALKEAEDFSPSSSRGGLIDVASVARGHRTTILKSGTDLPPVVAQQQYFAYAQQQLALASGNEPGASHALYSLGKIHSAMSAEGSAAQSLDGPRAMVFYQSALAVDSRNYLAANELGVLLARYGQLQEARQALVHSVSTRPHAQGWQNLAVVHRRLGETELARLAENERELIAKNPAAAPRAGADQIIEWVDPQIFAARGTHQQDWPAPAAAAATPTSSPPRR